MRLLTLILFLNFIYAKILIVNSYDKKDQCGIPQLNGFLYVLYNNNYQPDNFDIVFLNSRVRPLKDIKKEAKKLLKNIKNYDFVITFDDTAFKYVGIPASKKGVTVFFSGLNYPYEKYKKQYKLKHNIAGVTENLHTKELLKMYNKIIPINKIALIYSDGIGKIVKNQIESELKNSKFEKKLKIYHVNSINQLIKTAKKVNKNKKITIFIPTTFSLKEKNRKIPFYKFKNIYLEYIKKPDLSINLKFVQMGFVGFGGVDFYAMGKKCGRLFINYKKTHKLQIVHSPKVKYYINYQRAKEVGLKLPKWFIEKYVKDIVW